MMRIAVAGGGGLGFMLATGLSAAENAYNVVVLSRSVRREFADYGIQVHVVDYSDKEGLQFALQGIDLVISTVSGAEQLALINAAGHKRVRYFVPSEFEGSLSHRPSSHNDKLDRGSSQALALLCQWSEASRMKFTVFSCGVFMERFHPHGMCSLGAGVGSGVANSGDYLLEINSCAAEYVEADAKGHSAKLCLTSMFDVVRFVVAAVDMGPSHWPREYTMRGDKLSVRDIVSLCSAARNSPFKAHVIPYDQIQSYISYYAQVGDFDKVAYYQRLLATANGRYDFSKPNLNEIVTKSSKVHLRPVKFKDWLASVLG